MISRQARLETYLQHFYKVQLVFPITRVDTLVAMAAKEVRKSPHDDLDIDTLPPLPDFIQTFFFSDV